MGTPHRPQLGPLPPGPQLAREEYEATMRRMIRAEREMERERAEKGEQREARRRRALTHRVTALDPVPQVFGPRLPSRSARQGGASVGSGAPSAREPRPYHRRGTLRWSFVMVSAAA